MWSTVRLSLAWRGLQDLWLGGSGRTDDVGRAERRIRAGTVISTWSGRALGL